MSAPNPFLWEMTSPMILILKRWSFTCFHSPIHTILEMTSPEAREMAGVFFFFSALIAVLMMGRSILGLVGSLPEGRTTAPFPSEESRSKGWRDTECQRGHLAP